MGIGGVRLEDYLKYRVAEKEFDVVIVSRLVPYKGVREALAAATPFVSTSPCLRR